MDVKDVNKSLGSMGEALDIVTERGVLSALYLASLALPLLISATNLSVASQDFIWVTGICIILGLITSKITTEFLINIVRRITEPIVLSAFHGVVGSSEIFPQYPQYRQFRELFLATEDVNGDNYLRARILKNESILHTTTYLICTTLFALPVLLILLIFPKIAMIPRPVLIFELCFVVYVLIATYFAERSRAAALGRSVGHAYLKVYGTKK